MGADTGCPCSQVSSEQKMKLFKYVFGFKSYVTQVKMVVFLWISFYDQARLKRTPCTIKSKSKLKRQIGDNQMLFLSPKGILEGVV